MAAAMSPNAGLTVDITQDNGIISYLFGIIPNNLKTNKGGS